MTNAKAKNIAAVILLVLLTAVFGLCVWGGGGKSVTAQAASMPKYTMTFDYKHFYVYNGSPSLDGSASGTTSAVVQSNKAGDTVTFSLYGDSVSGTGVLPMGGGVQNRTVYISAGGSWNSVIIVVKNSAGTEVGKSSKSPIKLENLSDGTYTMTCSLTSKGGNPNPRAYAFYKMDVTSSFSVDTTAPTITGASASITGKYTSSAFTVSASDSGSGVENLYMKEPNSSSFRAVGASQYVSASGANGLYSFYAKDKSGLTSATHYVYLDTQKPTGKLYAGAQEINSGSRVSAEYVNYIAADLQSGVQTVYVKKPNTTSYVTTANNSKFTQDGQYSFYCKDKVGLISDTVTVTLDNSVPSGSIVKFDADNRAYFTWNNDTWTATLNGGKYEKNTWISAEGNYTVVLSNAVGKSATYTFAIDHKYIEQENILPTCTAEGYTVSKCITCGHTKRDITTEALGHNYSTAVTPPNCTDSGTKKYTCNRCGYEFVSEDALPSGHEYVGNLIHAANCTEHGERHFTCEKCGYEYDEDIQPCGHNYEITATEQVDGVTRRTYTCTVCGNSYTQDMGNQYEKVSNYVEYLFRLYKPYMVWVFIATAGVWSIVLGVMIILAYKNEDKEKSKKMLINYAVGMAIIFGILVACPYLVRGIAYLVT